MKGGNVSSRAINNNANATTLTMAILTFLERQRRPRMNQKRSQIRIAIVVTPESAPTGFEKIRALLMLGDASPASARTPTIAQPMPAERIAAAPGPLGIVSTASSVFAGFALILFSPASE